MRIGAICEPNAAANYRVRYPLLAMGWRGHETLWPDDAGKALPHELFGCDAVLIYRLASPEVRGLVAQLKRRGVAVVWDNDDDFLNLPKNRRNRQTTGRSNAQIFAAMARTAAMAHTFVTTTPQLAEVFRGAGAPPARIIENYVLPVDRPRRSPEAMASGRMTVGWIAGMEHRADATGLQLAATFRALQDRHPGLDVVTVGVELALTERYTHVPRSEFDALPEIIAGFDLGIAPLLDTPFNRSRSNIKVKEYAASGVPWVASPCGPYAELGEPHGGRLVPDDGWLDALSALVDDLPTRRRLAQNATAWATTQTFDVVVDQYETLFAQAVERATGRPAQTLVMPRAPEAAPPPEKKGRPVARLLTRSAAR
ncbi:MAG TPA: hypothetical protein VI318_11285 [Baekduia sp.]